MSDFLRVRNGNYYLRLRVPADLRKSFPDTEILKSLRTKDPKTARLSASSLRPRFLEIFTLTRCGFITDEQARKRIAEILNRQPKESSPTNHEENNAPPPPPSPSLTKIFEQYISDNKSGWTAKTQFEYETYCKLLLNILGDININSINRSAVRDLRDILTKVPKHFHQKYHGMSIKEVIKSTKDVPLSITSINKILRFLGSLMRHCIKEGFRADNPTDGLKIKQNRRADEERKAYSREDLKKIAAALPSPTKRPEWYWVPMIGMYSGMRLGEICGLHVADIRQVDNVWCFDVNEEDEKQLKTVSSTRLVPIHPQLISKGLLVVVENARTTGQIKLWSNLTLRDIDGCCSSLCTWYSKFNRKHITQDKLKTFHSLRHSFADTLKQKGVQESLIAELMGHKNKSITTGRYGKRYQPTPLLEAIKMIIYEEEDAKSETVTTEPSSDLSCGVT